MDLKGNPIFKLKEWKELHPEELHFDSKLEWFCYTELESSSLNFKYKPDSLTIVEKMVSLDWEYDKEQLRNLRDIQRGVTDRNEKAANTRSFNLKNSKALNEVKLPAWTWSADFYLPDFKFYIDTKGNKKDAHWRNKLKAARQLLSPDGIEVIQLQTKKEIIEFIKYIENER